jgi:hypothetical protein
MTIQGAMIMQRSMTVQRSILNASKTALTLTSVIVSKTELNYNMLFKEKGD